MRGDSCIDCNRIAAGIQKRVQELLPTEPAPEGIGVTESTPTPDAGGTADTASLPEAPASVNCHITLEGRQVQVTLRDTDETRLLQRLQALLKQYPMPAPQAPTQGQGQDWCPIHQTAMRQTTKEGRSWFSHKVDGRWCKDK